MRSNNTEVNFKSKPGECFYCNTNIHFFKLKAGDAVPPNLATIDHVLPRSKGGTNNIINRVWACSSCNSKKADTLPEFKVLRKLGLELTLRKNGKYTVLLKDKPNPPTIRTAQIIKSKKKGAKSRATAARRRQQKTSAALIKGYFNDK